MLLLYHLVYGGGKRWRDNGWMYENSLRGSATARWLVVVRARQRDGYSVCGSRSVGDLPGLRGQPVMPGNERSLFGRGPPPRTPALWIPARQARALMEAMESRIAALEAGKTQLSEENQRLRALLADAPAALKARRALN